MKKYTLNQTWTYCLAMWKWIAMVWKKSQEISVWELKEIWLRRHGWSKKDISDTCFFCHYAITHKHDPEEFCLSCPGKKVDDYFHCDNGEYRYDQRPIAFYEKLLALNKKRTKK